MEALGADVHIVEKPAASGGFLGARIDYVRSRTEADPRYVWLNQYANPGNWRAHFGTTAPSIASSFPELDVLFVGAGTTGTLMGCARYFKRWHRRVRVVAIDAVGSSTFGTTAAPRMIPGLGTSVRPEMLDESYVDDVVHVEEAETNRACHRLARAGFVFGGSTGTVVSGAIDWLERNHDLRPTAVAIAPDLGERYLETVYRSRWIHDCFGEEVLERVERSAPSVIDRHRSEGSTLERLPSAPATTTGSGADAFVDV